MKHRVPFLDLRVKDRAEKKELLEAVKRVLVHGRLVLGPEVSELETKLAKFCGRKYAVGVNSGTDALILALKSLHIGKGDEVITTSLSWVATANAIAMVGAAPVFADIRDDLNIDPDSVRRLMTKRTKAILPVDYTGRISDMDEIGEIVRKNHLMLVEDAAQAFGAKYKGNVAGSFGDMACFSMNPMKVYAALGEAGIVVTDHQQIYEKLIALRYNGTINKERCIEVSFNGRIDTIQAAMLLVRLKRFEKVIDKRRQNAKFYDETLKDIAGIIQLPLEHMGERNVYYTYTLRVKNRDELRLFLEKEGIETKIQHPYLMPDQPVYRQCPRDKLIRAQQIVKEIVCIPIHEKLSSRDLEYVANRVRKFYASFIQK